MLIQDRVSQNRKVIFSTKAEVLNALSSVLVKAEVLPLYFFSVGFWWSSREVVQAELKQKNWAFQKLVVRSSAIGEDGKEKSLAGQYDSVIGVQGEESFSEAVEQVIASFEDNNLNHQILVQPCLTDVIMSGVAFGRDPNTCGPYFVINYDDSTGSTISITSGQSNHKCYMRHHAAVTSVHSGYLTAVIELIKELQEIFDTDLLDIEFAIDQTEQLYLFQVRPLICNKSNISRKEEHENAIARIACRISIGMKPHPYLYGRQTVYGIMPDWNPAEIIGVRPKPLALSLYRELVTDAVWAYQRDNYGYANLRSFPLLLDFEGLPYIDVRVSFNSFLPKTLNPELGGRLVNYYLDRLIENQTLHDKVEFDIVFSCYTLDLPERLLILKKYGFTDDNCSEIYLSLVQLTNQIINNQQGLWRSDLKKIEELSCRQKELFSSDLDSVSKMFWILEDCKRYGTLPFAGLARAGFIAVQILKSFVAVGILDSKEYEDFISSVNSVSSTMNDDFQKESKEEFLKKYGHLRPGTYDILSFRYDEVPDLYFDWDKKKNPQESIKKSIFSLTIQQLRKIQEYIDKDALQMTALELLEFIKFSIEAREYSKFIFSKNVSEFLKLVEKFAFQFNIAREDCAYIDLRTIVSLYGTTMDFSKVLQRSIAVGKQRYKITSSINLPALITHESQVWSFELPDSIPNFVTQKKAIGCVVFADFQKKDISNAILMIPSADPGYDWIFSHNIAGFITKYGGINSHMAIRAGELGIPAIIGAGEVKFNEWSCATRLLIDCLNKQVKVL